MKPNYLKGLSHVLNRLPKPVLLPELPTVSLAVRASKQGLSHWPPAELRKGRRKSSRLITCVVMPAFPMAP